jgi:hypothetical protein
MNKVVNSMSLVFLILYAFFAFGSINDLNFSVYQLKEFPFLTQIIYGLALVIFLLGALRIKRRWTGLNDIKSFTKFTYSTKLSKKAIILATVFFIAEIIFMVFFLFLAVDSQKLDNGVILIPIFVTLILFVVETLIFIVKLHTSQNIKIGVTSNLIAYFDREINIYYFGGLQQIAVYQNRLHLKYRDELHMFMELDIIPEGELLNFKNAVAAVLKEKDVFFDESFRELGLGSES